MSIDTEKARITADLNRYLSGRHDATKRRIAEDCKASVALSTAFGELKLLLEGYRGRLGGHVAERNRTRFFKHKIGELDLVIAQAIDRCELEIQAAERYRTNLDKLFRRFNIQGDEGKRQTQLDWNRPGTEDEIDRRRPLLVMNRPSRPTGFRVNGTRWRWQGQGRVPTVAEIDTFLRSSGISNAAIRAYICERVNQGGFSAWAVVVSSEMLRRTDLRVGAMPSGEALHEIRNTNRLSVVRYRDVTPYQLFVPPDQTLKPGVFTFVNECYLTERSGEVTLEDVNMWLEDVDQAPETLAVPGAVIPTREILRTMLTTDIAV